MSLMHVKSRCGMLPSCLSILGRRHAAMTWRLSVRNCRRTGICRSRKLSSYDTELSVHPTTIVNNSEQLRELKELVRCGDYSKALSHWQHEKDLGRIDPAYCSVVMQLCEKIGSVQAAKALKDDMRKQDWNMNRSCSVHYLRILISEGLIEEALQFVVTSKMKEDEQFLAEVASVLREYGHLSSALEVCCMTNSLCLHVLRLEVLGLLKQQASMEQFVKEHYGDVCTAPTKVKLAVADGFSLVNQPAKALGVFTDIVGGSMTVPMRSVALAFESARRIQDWKTAAKIYNLLWKDSLLIAKGEEVDYVERSKQTFQSRAVNAAIYLQAFALRDGQRSKLGDELQSFVLHNFFGECLAPDQSTFKGLLLLCCFRESASQTAMEAWQKCMSSMQTLRPTSLTSWTQHCGPLHPSDAHRMVRLVRICRRICQLDLDLHDYAELLNLQYLVDDDLSLKKAVKCIWSIRNLNMLNKRNLLTSTKAYNIVLKAYSRLGAMGALCTDYKKMIEDQIAPDLETYHILVEGSLRTGSVRSTRRTVYDFWRSFVKEVPRIRPDTELINKFIECCGVCQEHERAFFYLSVLNEYSLLPNLETFKLLLQICKAANDRERLSVIKELACKYLPEETGTINNMAATIEHGWRRAEDVLLAQELLSKIE